jgi:hypothetical protein
MIRTAVSNNVPAWRSGDRKSSQFTDGLTALLRGVGVRWPAAASAGSHRERQIELLGAAYRAGTLQVDCGAMSESIMARAFEANALEAERAVMSKEVLRGKEKGVMRKDALTYKLAQLQEELLCMDAGRIVATEELLQEVRSALEFDGLGDLNAKAAAVAVQRLKMLAEHACTLYRGCLEAAYAVACGYTATGPASLDLYNRSLATEA